MQVIATALAGLFLGTAVISANRSGTWLWKKFYAKNSLLTRIVILASVVLVWVVHVALAFLAVVIVIPGRDPTSMEVTAFGVIGIAVVIFGYRKGWLKEIPK